MAAFCWAVNWRRRFLLLILDSFAVLILVAGTLRPDRFDGSLAIGNRVLRKLDCAHPRFAKFVNGLVSVDRSALHRSRL